MNKESLTELKKKIKKNAPIVIAAISTLTAAGTIVYYQTKMSLNISKEDLEVIKTEDVNMTYSIDGSDYSLSYRGNTPQN